MAKVIIGINEKGDPYVVSAPRRIEVVFKKPKKRPLKKKIRTLLYHLKKRA